MIIKEFLDSELKYRYSQMKSFITRPKDAVGRPLFFEPDGGRTSARVYVCSGKAFTASKRAVDSGALLLCAAAADFTPDPAIDCCVFPPETDLLALFNFIQRLFDRLDEWNQKLKLIAEGASEVPELLESAAGMLQNPVWLCDADGHIVARAERFFADMEHDETALSYTMTDFEESAEKEGDAHRIRCEDGSELLIAKLTAADTAFLLACAAKERPFYGSDETVFGYLSGYVKLMLSERKVSIRALRANRRNDAIEKHLRTLFDPAIPPDESLAALSKLGWDDQADYAVCAAETLSGDMRYALMHVFCDRIESAVPQCCAFYMPASVIGVIRIIPESDGQLIALDTFCAKEGLRLGWASSMRGLSFLSQRRDQARYTLSKAKAADKTTLAFGDTADDYLIEKSVSEFPAELICARAILAMADYDKAHKTAYIETAARYIANRFNAVKTANDLFIHRSTFLYRLERIKTQFGLDMDSKDALSLQTQVSLRIMTGNK